ncbi:hypothetical protein CSKR_200883 [Clonorchis sinensis]|uniref:Uncharacterized protein n=1 Tax=Clonorchis sinensis TaxID=79923 RepID=A0A8T1MI17_CLOSI|nr:hypothetical protein CSKR_200883 [Clonorchis sinensis]
MRAMVEKNGSTSGYTEFLIGVNRKCVLTPALFDLRLAAIMDVAFVNDDANVPLEYRFSGYPSSTERLGAKSLVP